MFVYNNHCVDILHKTVNDKFSDKNKYMYIIMPIRALSHVYTHIHVHVHTLVYCTYTFVLQWRRLEHGLLRSHSRRLRVHTGVLSRHPGAAGATVDAGAGE